MTNIFQGDLVRLRAIESANWEVFYQWDMDTDDARLLYEIPFPTLRDRVQAWAETQAKSEAKQDNFDFQVERLDGEVVGTISTHHCNPRCGTFMYGLAVLPPHRRKGYASEAVRLILRYYFEERRYQKVNAEVFNFNEPSKRLHERLGFVLEGRLRRMIYTQGQFHDVLIYGLTKEEFEASGRPSAG
jgi:RimJ/RimL family protein N-acetyltransferase